ncbi:MAG: hypothetical protein KIT14_12600 [bacterium]|nr:hypothetical protein [bacterium]
MIQVRVVAGEADRWAAEAKRRDVTVSALIRHAVRRLLREPDLPEITQ